MFSHHFLPNCKAVSNTSALVTLCDAPVLSSELVMRLAQKPENWLHFSLWVFMTP